MRDRNKLEEDLLSFLKNNKSKKYKIKELYDIFLIKQDEIECFNDALLNLQIDGQLYLNEYGEYMDFPNDSSLVVGKLKINRQGKYYVSALDKVFFISQNYLNGAIKGDIVLLTRNKNYVNGDKQAKVKQTIFRDTSKVLVDCINQNGTIKLVPYEKDYNFNINIDKEETNSLVDGDRVVVKLNEVSKNNYDSVILYHVGHKDDANLDIKTMAILDDIEVEFSEEVLEESKKISQQVSEEEIKDRVDFRNKLLFTIDGKDTKDMDDAISLEINENGNYVLGVHIADVSYYIKEGSVLFKEAYKRGTSVYPANFVIPMLPHIISNGICSLNPNTDRLTLSCIMEIDRSGKVIFSKIEESVINSKKKMSYEDVNKILEKGEVVNGYEDFIDNLKLMKELHQLLDKNKISRGYINFGDNDAKITIDEEGKVVGIKKLFRGVSEKMIEDFMLLANTEVAEQTPFIYRVHDHPNEDKMNEIVEKINELGFSIKTPKSLTNPYAIQGLLKQISNLEIYPILSEMILQGMKRAVYSTTNIGHFGLALKDYTHFTSPIRRFPDLMVHMMIKKMKQNQTINIEEIKKLEESCKHCSNMQKRADDFEKKVNFIKSAEYMENNKDTEFEAIVCYAGVNNIQVKTENEGIFGRIQLEDLVDNYKFVPNKMCLVSNNNEINLGDKILVKVKSVSKDDKKIYFKEVKEKKLVRTR